MTTAPLADLNAPAIQRGIAAENFDATIRAMPASLLEAPDAPFLDPAFSADPYTPLIALRDRAGPVVRRGADGTYDGQEIFNVWGQDITQPHYVVLGHVEATEIGTDKERFVNGAAYGAQESAHGRTVNTLDNEDHRRMRRLFDKAIFGRKAMGEWARDVTAPTVEYLVSRVKRMVADGEVACGMRDLAMPVAYTSIASIIGVPQADLGAFVALGERAQSGPRDMADALAAIAEMDDYFRQQLHERRKNPRVDMLTLMDAAVDDDGYRLTEDQVIAHCRFLLPGGIETTWRQTANVIMSLMLHPEQYADVVADPSLIEAATEEAARWAPSGFMVPRVVARDTEVAGVEMLAGGSINTLLGIANRDPRVYDNPNVFDIHRKRITHLTFHTGIHFCMGQNLARYTLRELVRVLALELPTLELACDRSEVTTQGFGVRNPTRLPLTAR